MEQKCVHKGCGRTFTSPDEECIYHPGPPEFHEGQKGWKCCKARVLTFDEFLAIPPCTTGKHSIVDDTPGPGPEPIPGQPSAAPQPVPVLDSQLGNGVPRKPVASAAPARATSISAPPEEESDDPSLPVAPGSKCRRRGCSATYVPDMSRKDEQCVHHPGQALFHEGSKGWTCCKRRVLEFDEFLKIKGCETKQLHLFLGNGNTVGEENVENVRCVSNSPTRKGFVKRITDAVTSRGNVPFPGRAVTYGLYVTRHDFYQTPTSVIASLYLKKIDKTTSSVDFSSPLTIDLDLHTSDNKRYKVQMPLYAPLDTEKSSFEILGTKVELNLYKTDCTSWPVLKKR